MEQHQMEATHLVTGHLLLTCPICGHQVQIDQETKEKRCLVDGDKMTVPHTWSMGGLCSETTGSKEEPQEAGTPSGTPACACRAAH